MIENSFITMFDTFQLETCESAMPVCNIDELQFFFEPRMNDLRPNAVAICNPNGDGIFNVQVADFALNHFSNNSNIPPLETLLAPNDCFRLMLSYIAPYPNAPRIRYYSSLLKFIPETSGFSLFEYWCNKPEFGFEYEGTKKNELHLPLLMKEPQYKQKDKLYERLDGSRVVLYSEINKEYECETEYLDEETHRKIIIALAHDNVRINGEEVVKTDSYEIEWNNTITSPCGEKLAKAKFKVQQNIKVRNSICG